MIIGIPTEGKNVSGHFGKCEEFTIVKIQEDKVITSEVISTIGNQHGLLPELLVQHGVTVVLAGGMGDGARNKLQEKGIEIYSGNSGEITEVIKDFIAGNLVKQDPNCSDHGHHHHDHHDDSHGSCNCGKH